MIKHKRKKIFIILLILLLILVIFRLMLPNIVTNYVNTTLDQIPDYTGSISGVNICLLKGEYRINDISIYKKGNEDSRPYFTAPAIDLAVQWSALKEGRIVGKIDVMSPEINVIMIEGEAENADSQTGEDVDWTEPIKNLMPLEINEFIIIDGKLSYLDPVQSPPIDIFANEIEIVATNFSNTYDSEHPLPSKIVLTGTSIGGGKMYMTTRINPLKLVPDLDYEFKFENIDLSSLNAFSDAYAALDFEGGTIDLYSEMVINDGNIKGYFKPVLNHIDLINFKEDIKNPLKLVWEGFAATILELFENQGKDQFATKIPLEGNLNAPETKVWPTLINVLRNAFVEAFTKTTDGTIDFGEENLKVFEKTKE